MNNKFRKKLNEDNAVDVNNPDLENQMGGELFTVMPKGNVINPYAEENTFILAKDKDGIIHAIDNQTGEILYSDVEKFLEEYNAEKYTQYGMAAENKTPKKIK